MTTSKSVEAKIKEIIADLNSAKPTSAISFLASFTKLNNLII